MWQGSEADKTNENCGRYLWKVSFLMGDICVSKWLTYKNLGKNRGCRCNADFVRWSTVKCEHGN